jgi:hypothetical protein
LVACCPRLVQLPLHRRHLALQSGNPGGEFRDGRVFLGAHFIQVSDQFGDLQL